jgi:hypothetical protein
VPVTAGPFRGLLVYAELAAVAGAVLVGCTDGATPDCSGNPSPCGYPLPSTGVDDAAIEADGGGLG